MVVRASTTGSHRTCIRVTCWVRGTSSTDLKKKRPDGEGRCASSGLPFFRRCTIAMMKPARKTRVLKGLAPDRIPFDELLAAGTPAILQGLARDWPLVRRGQESAASAVEYLKGFAG